MANSRGFEPGDLLVFQIESGYGVLQILAIGGSADDPTWHVAVFRDLFQEIEPIETMIAEHALTRDLPHVALTNRAFESTQMSRIGTLPITDGDLAGFRKWEADGLGTISDRSIRLMLGLR